ncbi:metal-dependent transcriptional regulator [Mariniflexile ostreae]|uniref:Transcriptional regulator MntR n=1 Tax=Mariniflexile ostreae TaxID=1520892 RepID=A0ABV5F6S6_9FLAO
MITLTEENYIKAIYHLGNQGADNVNTNALAEAMQTKASSATDMIKKLSDKNYAHYKKYQGVSLTEQGKRIAVNIIRKHRLWEVFLVEKLNFTWDEVHEVAEQLEHIKSLKLVNELDAFLGFPTHDPHGDPIPDSDGHYSHSKSVNILEMKIGHEGVLALVKDSSDAFLKYLNKNNLALGDAIKVLDVEPFDGSVTIETQNGQIIISKTVANNLYLNQG